MATSSRVWASRAASFLRLARPSSPSTSSFLFCYRSFSSVGDGPWEDMKEFDDKIPARVFDNFQFVNFTGIISRNGSSAEKEAAFVLAALMEIPIQYRAVMELGLLGQVTGTAKRVVARPPPVARPGPNLMRETTRRIDSQSSTNDGENQACPICLTNSRDMAFGCGHMTCRKCAENLTTCPICRTVIRTRLRVYSG